MLSLKTLNLLWPGKEPDAEPGDIQKRSVYSVEGRKPDKSIQNKAELAAQEWSVKKGFVNGGSIITQRAQQTRSTSKQSYISSLN